MTETLAPLLVKWLTHDFATPIATVMTASELLGDVADAEINGLVADAAKRLGGRLQLVRAAMAPGSGPMGAAGFEKLLRAGLHDTPLTFAMAADHVSDGAHAAVMSKTLRRWVENPFEHFDPIAPPDGEPASDAKP